MTEHKVQASESSAFVENRQKFQSVKRMSLRASDPRALVGLSVILALVGIMVMDPVAGFSSFVVAGILIFFAVVFGKKRLRYIALILLAVIIYLGISRYPETLRHYKSYKEHVQRRSVHTP